VVIDFEYAAANPPGLEFANHFSEWAYNYHDPARPWACDTSLYPTPEQQYRFIKAYVDHRPQFPYVESGSSPAVTPAVTPPAVAAGKEGGGGVLHTTPSTSSIVEFMLDARVPPGGWKEEERKREEQAEGKVRALMEETRLWRTANSAQWVAWGIVQAKITGVDDGGDGAGAGGGDGAGAGVNGTGDGDGAGKGGEKEGGRNTEAEEQEEEFDYLAYAQERAYFFLGDCVLMGLVKAEELGEGVKGRLKLVDY
jgi:choline kinase